MQVAPDLEFNVLERWDHEEKNHEQNVSLKGSKTFSGTDKKRRCTDVFCLILFILCNAGLAGLGYYIVITGDITRLGHGSDFRGDVCGVSGLSSKKYTYYPDPSDTTIALCLSECPKTTVSRSICYYDTDHTTLLPVWGCWDSIPSTVFAFYCFPKPSSDRKQVIDVFFSDQKLISQGGGSSINVLPIQTWDTVTAGILVSFIFSTIFLISFQSPEYFSNFIVYCQVQNCILLFCIAGSLYYDSYLTDTQLCKANNGVSPDYCYTSPELGLQVLSYLVFAGLILYIVVLVLNRRVSSISYEIIKITNEPLKKIKKICFLPLASIFFGLAVIGGLFVLVLWTLSIGNIVDIQNNNVPGGYVRSLEFAVTDKLVLSYILLMFFWWLSFFVAIGEFVVSGVVSTWYFTKEKSAVFKPVSRSIRNCLGYHLGSVIRGSLYNLLLFLPNLVLSGLNRLVISHSKHKASLVLAYLCCPCLYAYHRFFKYTSKLSYMYLSMFGQPYSISSRQSYYLLYRNGKRLKQPLFSCRYSIFQAKFSIVLLGFFTTYAICVFSPESFTGFSTEDLSSRLAPAVFSFLACLYLAEAAGGFFVACVCAMTVCGVVDQEMFTAEQRFMNGDLQKVLDGVEGETRNAELKCIEVQKPGRSYRHQANVVEFDEFFNAKVQPTTSRNGFDSSNIDIKDI